MPKPSRGGQRTRWAAQYAQQQTPTPQDEDEEEIIVDVKDDDVADAPKPEDIVKEEAAAVSHDDIDWDNREFTDLSQADYDQIYKDNHNSYYKNGNIINAKKMYESQSHKTTDGYTYSQDMNHRLNHGLKLDADSKFMSKYLTMGLHPIGKNCMLTRAAHDTLVNQLLKQSGINQSYDQLSPSQLKTALVGTEYQMKSFGSFGANDAKNPFIGGAQGGGREVIIHARTADTCKVIAGSRAQEEFVTGIGQRARITDIQVTNQTAWTRTKGAKQIIHLYVDQW